MHSISTTCLGRSTVCLRMSDSPRMCIAIAGALILVVAGCSSGSNGTDEALFSISYREPRWCRT